MPLTLCAHLTPLTKGIPLFLYLPPSTPNLWRGHASPSYWSSKIFPTSSPHTLFTMFTFYLKCGMYIFLVLRQGPVPNNLFQRATGEKQVFFHITRCGIWTFSFDSLLSDIRFFSLSLFFLVSNLLWWPKILWAK